LDSVHARELVSAHPPVPMETFAKLVLVLLELLDLVALMPPFLAATATCVLKIFAFPPLDVISLQLLALLLIFATLLLVYQVLVANSHLFPVFPPAHVTAVPVWSLLEVVSTPHCHAIDASILPLLVLHSLVSTTNAMEPMDNVNQLPSTVMMETTAP